MNFAFAVDLSGLRRRISTSIACVFFRIVSASDLNAMALYWQSGIAAAAAAPPLSPNVANSGIISDLTTDVTRRRY
jgi:hypothetical protein